ncbi:MAG: transposase [Cyanobacteriota bacterium]
MNQVLTISCKLKVSESQATKLDATLDAFGQALNWVNQNTPEKIVNAVKLQSLCYYEIRNRFGLSSNLAQQVCRRVAGSRKVAKRKNRPVKGLKAGFVTYDARIFSFREKDWTVSLTTIEGRERFELAIGNYQRGMLAGSNPKSATLVKRQDGSYYIQICLESQPPKPSDTSKVLGVDLGRTDIAHTSEGQHWNGKDITQVRDHFANLRAKLQHKASKGTRSSRRRCRQLLQRLSGRERRFQSWVNHNVSKRIVATAETLSASVALEDLTGIRERTNQQPRNKTERRRSNSWAFHQLRLFVCYKALWSGVKVVFVDPRYTSQTCHQCLHIHPDPGQSYRAPHGAERQRRGKQFRCGHCGWHGDADFNGAKNIQAIGTLVNRPGGSWLSCQITGGLLKARALPVRVSVG